MINMRVIAIEENPELITEANKILLRTDQSIDINDNREIASMIDKILNYIQASEAPIISKIKKEYEHNLQPIQLIYYRPSTDEIVKKLFDRKKEIRERHKMNVIKIHFDDRRIDVFCEEE